MMCFSLPNKSLSQSWFSSDLLSQGFFYHLTRTDHDALRQMLNSLPDLDVLEIPKSLFQLNTLEKAFNESLIPQLYSGIGVLLIKGLSPNDYTEDDLLKIHWALGSYLGRAQLQYGENILRVEHQGGYRLNDPEGRNNNTAEALWFHNDSCDLSALLCVRQAKRGGQTQIVSSAAIHDMIRTQYPKLLEVLYAPFYRTYRHISNLSDEGKVHQLPVFEYKDNEFSCDLSRPIIEKAQKIKGVPQLSPIQRKALDTVERLAADPELCYTFFLEPGDIIYMNNHVVLHARKAFEDSREAGKKRLLLRLHLEFHPARGNTDGF